MFRYLFGKKIYIVVFTDVSGRYRWRLVGKNSEILASSESYSSKQACLDTVELILNCTIKK